MYSRVVELDVVRFNGSGSIRPWMEVRLDCSAEFKDHVIWPAKLSFCRANGSAVVHRWGSDRLLYTTLCYDMMDWFL